MSLAARSWDAEEKPDHRILVKRRPFVGVCRSVLRKNAGKQEGETENVSEKDRRERYIANQAFNEGEVRTIIRWCYTQLIYMC